MYLRKVVRRPQGVAKRLCRIVRCDLCVLLDLQSVRCWSIRLGGGFEWEYRGCPCLRGVAAQGSVASEVAGCLSAEWAIDWHGVEQWSLPVGQLPECAGGVRNRSYR
jgi:hypothetical protein